MLLLVIIFRIEVQPFHMKSSEHFDSTREAYGRSFAARAQQADNGSLVPRLALVQHTTATGHKCDVFDNRKRIHRSRIKPRHQREYQYELIALICVGPQHQSRDGGIHGS